MEDGTWQLARASEMRPRRALRQPPVGVPLYPFVENSRRRRFVRHLPSRTRPRSAARVQLGPVPRTSSPNTKSAQPHMCDGCVIRPRENPSTLPKLVSDATRCADIGTLCLNCFQQPRPLRPHLTQTTPASFVASPSKARLRVRARTPPFELPAAPVVPIAADGIHLRRPLLRPPARAVVGRKRRVRHLWA